MPCDSTTSSPAVTSSSHPSSYDIPEPPPPTTRMRRPHSGLPSSRRRSETFFAAVGVSVIMSEPPVTLAGATPYLPALYHRIPPAGRRVSSSSVAPAGRAAISTTASATCSGRSIFRRSGALETACRSEEHTSELQSLAYLVCRLLLEKKKS